MRGGLTERDMQSGIIEADLVIVRPPEVMVLELKGPGGRISPKQKEWIEALQDTTQITAAVLRPIGYDATLRHLSRPSRRAERLSHALTGD